MKTIRNSGEGLGCGFFLYFRSHNNMHYALPHHKTRAAGSHG